MYNIIKTKDNAVTIGVVDRNLAVAENLREVTYDDIFGTRHTVYAHKDGPFTTPEDVVEAHRAGTLHPFANHDTAITYSRERGDNVTADRVAALQTSETPADRGGEDDE